MKQSKAAAEADRRQKRNQQLKDHCIQVEQLAQTYQRQLLGNSHDRVLQHSLAENEQETADTNTTNTFASSQSSSNESNDPSFAELELRLTLLMESLHREMEPKPIDMNEETATNASSPQAQEEPLETSVSANKPTAGYTKETAESLQDGAIETEQVTEHQHAGPEEEAPLVNIPNIREIRQSEQKFRGVTRSLASIAATAARDCTTLSSSNHHEESTANPTTAAESQPQANNNNTTVSPQLQLLDLALAALRGLHRIHHDRRAVMENTLVAQSLEQLHAEQDKDQGKPNSFWQTTVKGIVNFLTGRAQKEEEEADSESKPDDNPKNSKSDAEIHEYTKVEQSTTLNVLRPMLFSFARLLQAQQPHRRNPVRQELDSPCPEYCREVSERFIELLDIVSKQDPTFSILDASQTEKVLQFLCLGGTLNSAEWCQHLYMARKDDKPPGRGKRDEVVDEDGEKIVWRAYVQVAKNKDCPMTERQEAVRKLKRLFMDRWNTNYPFSKVQRLEQTLAVIAAVCEISDQGLEEEFQQFVVTVVRRFWGKDFYEGFRKTLEEAKDLKKYLNGRDPALIDSLAGAYACHDLTTSQKLMEVLLDVKSLRISAETTDRYIEQLLRHYYDTPKSDRNSVSDVEFVMALLDSSMSKSESLTSTSQHTFSMISKLLTLISPPQVGQHFTTWLAHLELRTLIGGGDVQVKGADYKRVLWAYWQEAKQKGETPPEELYWSKKAWDLLVKMDSLTTPLLMNATEVRRSKGGRLKMLYDIDDQPSQRAYEIVLNIICEEVGSNVEPATLLFLKVLALAERNKVDLSHWKLNRMPDWVISSGKQATETS